MEITAITPSRFEALEFEFECSELLEVVCTDQTHPSLSSQSRVQTYSCPRPSRHQSTLQNSTSGAITPLLPQAWDSQDVRIQSGNQVSDLPNRTGTGQRVGRE